MAIRGSRFQPEAEPKPTGESRFGNIRELTEALERDPARIIGTIEDLYQHIPEHTNEVQIADLLHEHSNKVLNVEVQHGTDTIRCVFKPESGENPEEKKRFAIASLAEREVAAWEVDRHFGLDLIPPTVFREIEGERGALQLFVDPTRYDTVRNLIGVHKLPKRRVDTYRTGQDYYSIALLDAIILNTERKNDNFLASITEPRKLIAIDHGYSFSQEVFEKTYLRGPLMNLTVRDERTKRGGWDAQLKEPTKIPAPLLRRLEDGLRRKDALAALLRDRAIPPPDIEVVLKMTENLHKLKIYLSNEWY